MELVAAIHPPLFRVANMTIVSSAMPLIGRCRDPHARTVHRRLKENQPVPFDEISTPREGSIIDRRNLMLGYWAGMRLGFFGEKLSHYAQDMIKADDEIPGPEDVIAKIVTDFETRGIDYPSDLIRMELERLERQVRAEYLIQS
jgi:hypothetical protein